MNHHDNIELLVNHAIAQGEYSQLYMDRLSAMNDDELIAELERVKDLADAQAFANNLLQIILKK